MSYNLNNILYDLNINYNSFIDLCILLGNDYNNRPRGLNPDKILNIIKEYKTIENLLKNNIIYPLNFNYETIRDIIKLKDVKPNIIKLSQQINKKVNLDLLKEFLRTNSTIDQNTYLHRISLMFKNNKKQGYYSSNNFFFKNNSNLNKNIEYSRYNPKF